MEQVDVDELRDKVKVMYRAVADAPQGTFHFEMGRNLAERLGSGPVRWTAYPPKPSNRSPASVGTSVWRRSQPVSGWSTSGAVPAWTRFSRRTIPDRKARSSVST